MSMYEHEMFERRIYDAYVEECEDEEPLDFEDWYMNEHDL